MDALYVAEFDGHGQSPAGKRGWFQTNIITPTGMAINYIPKPNGKLARTFLGYAMGCVKEEDTVLLPLWKS